MNQWHTILLSAVVGALVGSGVTTVTTPKKIPSTQDRIKEFYEIENAVHVSPHSLRTKMTKGDTSSYVLVDLRSPQEYEKEHVATAINIPAYKDPNTPAYEEKDRIISAFHALPKEKDIIVYCYSMPCMTGRKIGKMLAENEIYVKHLGIGWNEWRYYWNLWNHDGESLTKMEDYIVTGTEAGLPKGGTVLTPCTEGEFGC